MKAPAPYWSMTYAADRRKHRHRCVCGCNQIVQPGETVFMARCVTGKTRVLKTDHADRFHSTPEVGFTALDALEARGLEYLAGCGWAEAKAAIEASPFFRGGGVKGQA